MRLGYPDSNYHSETAAKFAEEITKAANGELEVVTHPGGSLFSGGEISRAVRSGQAPIGERLISALGHEDPLFATASLPFLATSLDTAWTTYQPSTPTHASPPAAACPTLPLPQSSQPLVHSPKHALNPHAP